MWQVPGAHWIVLVEPGDTPEVIARWIEQHGYIQGLTSIGELGEQVRFEEGGIDPASWVIQPRPGHVFIFNAPLTPNTGSNRFPCWVDEPRYQDREALEYEMTKDWYDERDREWKGVRLFRKIVQMCTKLFKRP